MDAIKKKMQAMKIDKDGALERALVCEQQARDANTRAEKVCNYIIYMYICISKLQLFDKLTNNQQNSYNHSNGLIEKRTFDSIAANSEFFFSHLTYKCLLFVH